MKNINRDFIVGIASEFKWHNEPKKHSFNNGLVIKTEPYTDFWQRTHYGFRRDNGHCYLAKKIGDFSIMAHFIFTYKTQYDQCGIILRIDENNWVKASMEYENENISRLGSVVTNHGYSDWATTDISSAVKSMWYKLNKNGRDILIENSNDGVNWKQMRILHLRNNSEKVKIGIYACSPQNSTFECKVTKIIMSKNTWEYKEE